MWPFKKSAVEASASAVSSDNVALSAIAAHIGAKPTKVFAGGDVSVGFWSADAAGRPAGTLVALGMSKRPMTLDERAVDTDTKRAEMVCYSDPGAADLETLVHWMQVAAAIPFEHGAAGFLGWGHTKRVGPSFQTLR